MLCVFRSRRHENEEGVGEVEVFERERGIMVVEICGKGEEENVWAYETGSRLD